MKILILSASTGGGHNRASHALKTYIESVDNTASVEIIDTLEYCSAMLNKTITYGYKALAKNAPELYGTFYKRADKESAVSELVATVMTQYAKKLEPLLDEKQPDVIVSCHPFASNMISLIKQESKLTIPAVSIITDFMPHRAYVGDYIDAYITASDDTKQNLSEKYNIPAEKIYPYGMPIHKGFYNYDESKKLKTLNDLGFDKDKPTVLIMAGSFGVTDILKIYEHLVEIELDYQIIVITGKNTRLYDAFDKLLKKDSDEFETHDLSEIFTKPEDVSTVKFLYEANEQVRHEIRSKIARTFRRSTNKQKPTKLFYFVDNVEDYMHISDLIITKPGGLTTSESLSCALPMAVFKAFPGQEEQNADFLVEKNAAIILEKGKNAREQIEYLLTHKDELNIMKENCKNYSRPDASQKIYELIKDIVNTKD